MSFPGKYSDAWFLVGITTSERNKTTKKVSVSSSTGAKRTIIKHFRQKLEIFEFEASEYDQTATQCPSLTGNECDMMTPNTDVGDVIYAGVSFDPITGKVTWRRKTLGYIFPPPWGSTVSHDGKWEQVGQEIISGEV